MDYSCRGTSAMQADGLLTRRLTEADLPKGVEETGTTFERHIVLSDLHYRNYLVKEYDAESGTYRTRRAQAHDPRALAATEKFMHEWQPTHIWLNGDMLDAAQISKYDKDVGELEGLEDDIQGLRGILARIRRDHPDAEIHYLLGNHEARLESLLRKNAPALQYLNSLAWEALFGSRELRITIYPYRVRVPILPGVLEVTHGDKVAAKSGHTAHKMLDMGISGVSGHVHRLGMVYKTDRRGTVVWAEGGCLCDLSPSYVASPNWQQGVTLIHTDRQEERFYMEQAPIIKGRLFHAGRVYG